MAEELIRLREKIKAAEEVCEGLPARTEDWRVAMAQLTALQNKENILIQQNQGEQR